MADAENNSPVVLSNTTVVREADGRLAVYVNDAKIIGAINIQIVNGDSGMPTLVLGLPHHRFRLADGVPLAPVVQNADNVIQFANFRRAQQDAELDAPPTTDGDSA